MKYIIPLLIVLLGIFFLYPQLIFAEEIKPYQITEGQKFVGDPHLPTILMYKTITLPWKSGKVVIAGNPDGTGDLDVGVQFEVYGSNTANSFKWYAGCDEKPMQPLDISHLMGAKYAHLGGDSNIMIRYNKVFCNNSVKIDGVYKNYYDIGPAYLVHIDDASEIIEPFLSLPWNYTDSGKRFENVAMTMTSYFDHAYPLLSTNLIESDIENDSIITYRGSPESVSYSSHDGYDWARKSGVKFLDPVLAAASGTATFKKYGACGNMIMIDHGNDFQTRYCHLDSSDLVTTDAPIHIAQGAMIGRVGMSGNTTGPHIHFMVVQDKDRNGNFDDNIPDGLVDPFGWQGSAPDPWESYAFDYKGESRTGNKSEYLWLETLPSLKSSLNSTGKTVTIDNTKVTIPANFVTQDTIIEINSAPPVPKPTFDEVVDGVFTSIGNGIKIRINDGFNNYLTQFSKTFSIAMNFAGFDISRYDPSTLSIFSSRDGVSWLKESTVLDLNRHTASTDVNHLTEFAVMGKLLDGIAPITTIDIDGLKYSENKYLLPVTISFTSTDEPQDQSLGVENSYYRINGDEMQIYTDLIALNDIGDYNIEFYSVDRDGNAESINDVAFSIITPPTPTPTSAPTLTQAPTATPTSTPSPTNTPAPTLTLTLTQTPTPTVTLSTTPTTTSTVTPTETPIKTVKKKAKNEHEIKPKVLGEVKSVIDERDPLVAKLLRLLDWLLKFISSYLGANI